MRMAGRFSSAGIAAVTEAARAEPSGPLRTTRRLRPGMPRRRSEPATASLTAMTRSPSPMSKAARSNSLWTEVTRR